LKMNPENGVLKIMIGVLLTEISVSTYNKYLLIILYINIKKRIKKKKGIISKLIQ